MKQQIVVIHGGTTFDSYDNFLNYLKSQEIYLDRLRGLKNWKETLQNYLGHDFDVILAKMPNKNNAKYLEWAIYFNNLVPLLDDDLILVGHSLGGIFLAKYLSENKLPKKMLSVYLIASPFDNSLPGEDLVGGFKLGADLSLIEKNVKNINLLFSKDDQIVPLSHVEKYRVKLPRASFVIFESKNGHFLVSEFPEIVKMIKGEVKINNEFGKTN